MGGPGYRIGERVTGRAPDSPGRLAQRGGSPGEARWREDSGDLRYRGAASRPHPAARHRKVTDDPEEIEAGVGECHLLPALSKLAQRHRGGIHCHALAVAFRRPRVCAAGAGGGRARQRPCGHRRGSAADAGRGDVPEPRRSRGLSHDHLLRRHWCGLRQRLHRGTGAHRLRRMQPADGHRAFGGRELSPRRSRARGHWPLRQHGRQLRLPTAGRARFLLRDHDRLVALGTRLPRA